LEKAIAMAPYWPDGLVEQGFVLNQEHRYQEALASYRKALALAGGVILTTVTDVIGFLSFLGLATLVLLH
jgi:hypothetical protein